MAPRKARPAAPSRPDDRGGQGRERRGEGLARRANTQDRRDPAGDRRRPSQPPSQRADRPVWPGSPTRPRGPAGPGRPARAGGGGYGLRAGPQDGPRRGPWPDRRFGADLGAQPAEVRVGVHAVEEALRAGKVVRLFLQEGMRDRPRLAGLAALAEQSSIPVQTLSADAIDVRAQQALHQGALAEVKPFRYVELEDVVEAAGAREEPLFLLVLDGVEDPQNLGAILRTADAAGVHGVVLPERRAAPVTALVARASAGAVDHVPVAQVTNLNRALDALKAAGAWVYALDMDGDQEYDAVDYTGAVVLVAGAEGKGVSRLVRARSDGVVRIPLRGKVESLNVSVATSLALYAVRRSRDRANDDVQESEGAPDKAEAE